MYHLELLRNTILLDYDFNQANCPLKRLSNDGVHDTVQNIMYIIMNRANITVHLLKHTEMGILNNCCKLILKTSIESYFVTPSLTFLEISKILQSY